MEYYRRLSFLHGRMILKWNFLFFKLQISIMQTTDLQISISKITDFEFISQVTDFNFVKFRKL